MPVHKVKGDWQWGSSGKVYADKAEAEAQARAAYANGYREGEGGDSETKKRKRRALREAMKASGK
jgi:hypothetical protein